MLFHVVSIAHMCLQIGEHSPTTLSPTPPVASTPKTGNRMMKSMKKTFRSLRVKKRPSSREGEPLHHSFSGGSSGFYPGMATFKIYFHRHDEAQGQFHPGELLNQLF